MLDVSFWQKLPLALEGGHGSKVPNSVFVSVAESGITQQVRWRSATASALR
jgi:hypothetical protein